jgi:uncharacterized integral membrane protein
VCVLPWVNPGLDIHLLVERETTGVGGLPRLRPSGHPRDGDLASVAEALGRMITPRRSVADPPREASGPLSPSSNGQAAVPRPQQSHRSRRRPTRLGSLHVGLVVAAVALVLLVIFMVQNEHSVDVSFLGGHLRVSLAVAMLIGAVAGALIVGAAGTARIGQLRRSARRDSRTNDNR